MVSQAKFIYFLMLISVFALPCAFASEALFFGDDSGTLSTQQINNALGDDQRAFKTARADLNNDGLAEIIAQMQPCQPDQALCDFYIFADTPRGLSLTQIGAFQAFGLSIANAGPAGVRRIHIYNNPANDFDYNLYVWNALESRYQMTQKQE